MINTKLILLTLFVLFLIVPISNAYNVPKIQDTTKTKHILDELLNRPPYESEYKLNKASFYSKYGFDFTAKRIIDRHFSQKNMFIFLIVSPLIGYVLLAMSFTLLSVSLGGAGVGLFMFSLLLYLIAWILRIIGIVKLVEHKKIDLLYQLIEYRKTGNTSFGQKPVPSKNEEKDYYELK